jgi:hypothetical protein
MDSVDTSISNISVHRHYVRVMAFVLGVALAIVIGVSFFVTNISLAPSEVEGENVTQTTLFARSAPIRLVIPKLSIDTSFEDPLALHPDKTIAVPESYDKVGWYEGGATPGEVGSSVILGHVDSFEGPAVFYNIGKLEAGDEVFIDRSDGTSAVFIVERLARYARADFPTEEVYGKTDTPTLKLITCSGIFNKGKQEYSHNLVVYAVLKN